MDWAVEIQGFNILLNGTSSFLSETLLCNQLEASHQADLSTACCHNLIDSITNFKHWLEAVAEMDNKYCRELNIQCQLIEEALSRERGKKNEQKPTAQTGDH